MTSDGIETPENGSVPSVATHHTSSRKKMLWLNWSSTLANFPRQILVNVPKSCEGL